jgi:hypothetical protein
VGRRARKRAADSQPDAQARAAGPGSRAEASTSPAAARSEARNAAARARLEPLTEGERPRAVTVGAIVAAVAGVVQVGLWVSGVQARGTQSAFFAPVFGLLLLITAWGMWRARYWAVLGFQVLLALTLIIIALAVLITAPLVQGVIGTVVILIPGGVLFWFLVKAMARIQMPQRR